MSTPIKTIDNVQSLGIPGAPLTVISDTTFNGAVILTNGLTLPGITVQGAAVIDILDVIGSNCLFRQGATVGGINGLIVNGGCPTLLGGTLGVTGITTLGTTIANNITVTNGLNVNGAGTAFYVANGAQVGGTLTVGQGYQISYSSLPALNIQHIGYKYNNTFNNFTANTANQPVNITSVLLQPGVYFIELYAFTGALTTVGTSVSLSISINSAQISLSNMANPLSTVAFQSLSLRTCGVVSIPNSNFVYFVGQSSQSNTTFTGGFQFTRLA
jgi:hypothetical protein